MRRQEIGIAEGKHVRIAIKEIDEIEHITLNRRNFYPRTT